MEALEGKHGRYDVARLDTMNDHHVFTNTRPPSYGAASKVYKRALVLFGGSETFFENGTFPI